MSMLKPILKNGDLLNSMLDWNVSLLQGGGNVGGVIAAEGELTQEQYDRAKEQTKNEYSGIENVGKYMLLENGTKFYQTSTSPKDMDWIKGKESAAKDICMGIGVDPLIIGFSESATYDNKREAEKGLYTKVVIPTMRDLADQLTPFLGVEEGSFIDVDYSNIPVLQEDVKVLNEKLTNNDMSINEKRAARGLKAVEGGDIIAPSGSYAIVDGKVYLPMNLIQIGEENTPPEGEQNNQQDNKKSFQY